MENKEVSQSEGWLSAKGWLPGIALAIILAVLTATIQIDNAEWRVRIHSNQIVGTINGENLTRGDFETEIALEEVKIDLRNQDNKTVNKAELLNRIIGDVLILQAASKAGIEVNQDEVNQETTTILRRLDMTRNEFEDLLSDHAIRWMAFEQSVEDYLTIFHYVNDGLMVNIPFGDRESYLQNWISGQYSQAEIDFEQAFLDEVNENQGECKNCSTKSPVY